MYFAFGREVLGGLAVLDAVDLAVGRGAGVDGALARSTASAKISGWSAVHSSEALAGAVDADTGGRDGRWRRRATPSGACATLQITGWSRGEDGVDFAARARGGLRG